MSLVSTNQDELVANFIQVIEIKGKQKQIKIGKTQNIKLKDCKLNETNNFNNNFNKTTMSFNEKSLNHFIQYITKFKSVDDILSTCKNQAEAGFIFERLWDIIIKFGYCDKFQGPEFKHMIGNVNTCSIKQLSSLNTYVNTEKIISGNSGGCSDITLLKSNCSQSTDLNAEYIFITSKYPKTTDDITKQKSVSYYDVQNIVSMADANRHIYTSYSIYLLVPDKNAILEKVQNANRSSEYITKYMTKDNILDKSDLNKYFLQLKSDLYTHTVGKDPQCTIDYDALFMSRKPELQLRFHQELITQKTVDLITKQKQSSILWGCKCRSGKTYMIGGLISKLFAVKRMLNVLIITPAPTETIPQFTDDLFDKFADFTSFKIHNIKGGESLKNIVLGASNIFIMSKQLLQRYIGANTIQLIKKLQLDIIGFDENHFSGTTDLSKEILTSYMSPNSVKVYLTATYNKPLQEWKIPSTCQMYWDIEDEQICKSIIVNTTHTNASTNDNTTKLIDKHGPYVTSTIDNFNKMGYTLYEMFSPYLNMPDLQLITTVFDSDKYEQIKNKITDSKYGFSFNTLFTLNPQKTAFKFENEVQTILRYISGSCKEIDYKSEDMSLFGRINSICSNGQARKPFTQIWFLPSDNINEISECLKQCMQNDSILKKYDVLSINRKNKELAQDIKVEITNAEQIAKANGKQGVILLAGNMLSLGISLHKCDIVALMNDSLSADKVLQQMMRCMTEGNNKKYGFVVDLNVSRVLNTCINYSIYKNDMSAEDKLKYIINNHLINIDIDMLQNKKLNSDMLVSKLMDIWKGDPVNNFRCLLQNLENDYVEFDTSTQKLINNSFTSSLKDDKVNTIIELKNDDVELQILPSGEETIHTETNPISNKEIVEKEEIKISFTKDVLPYVIPLTCILTIKDSKKDFVNMLSNIQTNPELLDIFDDMCLTWWGKKDLINIIKNIVSKHFDKNSNTYNISINFKMSLQSLIDNPKELLELINECLKPKEIEKKKFGEVFTPPDFINNNMLHDLEIYYKEKYNINIYEDETLKWGDTTAGMGNFPIAIYYKLMDGLKHKIPNDQERKKHILEKMLFMAEYNKKNCYVIKQIFNMNNEFKLNLYEGDSLQLDIQSIFGIDKFDILIGNPPYNEELKATGAKPLYNKFVEYYIDKCKLLCFVIPSRWFSGGKGLDGFRKNMLERSDIVYIKHFDDACKIFGNTVDIKGGVNYFLKDANHNGDCNFNGSITKLNKYDVFITSKFHSLIDKFINLESITKYYISQDYYKIQTNDTRLISEKKNGTIKCYVSQQKGFEKYIDETEIKKDITTWKVITARAAYEHQSGFGNTFIGMPNEVHTKSYISFNVNNEHEANSLLSYMKCRLPNFLLSLRKASQDISESTCKWIPLPPLDRNWTDDEVYKYFKLTVVDIKLINDTNIIGYKNNITPSTQDNMHTVCTGIQTQQVNSSASSVTQSNIHIPYNTPCVQFDIDYLTQQSLETLKEIKRQNKIRCKVNIESCEEYIRIITEWYIKKNTPKKTKIQAVLNFDVTPPN